MDNKMETTVLHTGIFVGICRRDEIGIVKKVAAYCPNNGELMEHQVDILGPFTGIFGVI